LLTILKFHIRSFGGFFTTSDEITDQLFWRTEKWRKFVRSVVTASQIQPLSPTSIPSSFVSLSMSDSTSTCLGMICEAFTSHPVDGFPFLPGSLT
jgi:hypothetical protein